MGGLSMHKKRQYVPRDGRLTLRVNSLERERFEFVSQRNFCGIAQAIRMLVLRESERLSSTDSAQKPIS